MWGMNFRVRSFFLPTHDYTHPCDGQTLSGYDFSAVGYDFFLPTHMALALISIKNCVNGRAYVVRLRGSAELECRFRITFYVKFYSR